MTRRLFLFVFHLVYLVLILSKVVQAETINQYDSTTRSYEFNITLQSINPDCSDYTAPVFLINKQMPGPAITANKGDTVRVKIRNQLSKISGHNHDVSIHFHGIRQYGTNEADGVPYLTQLPIKPGEEFIQEFRVVNQAGTFFYHAHVGLQEETVFGPLIVYDSQKSNPGNLIDAAASNFAPAPLQGGPFQYDDERTILLSEWWHRPHIEFENWLMGPNFTFIPEASSILINGKTVFDSTRPVMTQCGGYAIVPVQPNKTYRIRVIGATAFRTLGFAIARHNLTIIEVDGDLVKPYTVNQLEVAPGQRFSVLVHTDKEPYDYAIQVVRRWSDNVRRETNGIAVMHYHQPFAHLNSAETEDGSRGILRFKEPVMLEAPLTRPQFETPDQELPYWIWKKLEPYYGVDPVIRKPASRTIMARSVDRRLPDGSLRWQVNGIAYSEIGSNPQPILYEVINNRRRLPGRYNVSTSFGYDRNLGTYPLKHFEIVDIVLQTTRKPDEPCRSHPWHTHGHSHWEIAHGSGEYDEERDGNIRNVPNPIQKDVTLVYPHDDTPLFTNNDTEVKSPVGCGWSKIRIIADNPGIWAVHCHNTIHMFQGMMFILEEAPELIPKTLNGRV